MGWLWRFTSLEAGLITIYGQNGDWAPQENKPEGWHDRLEKAGIAIGPPRLHIDSLFVGMSPPQESFLMRKHPTNSDNSRLLKCDQIHVD